MTSERSEDKERIVQFLQQQLDDGERYIRSSKIGEHLNLSPKQVGVHLGHLEGDLSKLRLSKWSRHRSTTWHIQPNDS